MISNCATTYLMNHNLHQKQEPFAIITKSLNQNPNIKAEKSDKIEPLENLKISIFVFDGKLLSKQESNIDLFFTQGRNQNTDIYYMSQNYLHLPL